MRKVGVEIECSNVTLLQVAHSLAKHYNARVTQENDFYATVSADDLGDFTVEFDTSLLKDKRYRDKLANIGITLPAEAEDFTESLLKKALGVVVPIEVVCPPVELGKLARIGEVVELLRNQGAQGTNASFLYAFGLHLNPETPRFDSDYLVAMLRAFFMSISDLENEERRDISRRASGFVTMFPDEYVKLVCDPRYHPSRAALIEDYLSHNPTRNRALDLLPMFASISEKDISGRIEDDKRLIQPRPTFHYRLPNCRVDEPDWSLAYEWNRWVEIEQCAQKHLRSDV